MTEIEPFTNGYPDARDLPAQMAKRIVELRDLYNRRLNGGNVSSYTTRIRLEYEDLERELNAFVS